MISKSSVLLLLVAALASGCNSGSGSDSSTDSSSSASTGSTSTSSESTSSSDSNISESESVIRSSICADELEALLDERGEPEEVTLYDSGSYHNHDYWYWCDGYHMGFNWNDDDTECTPSTYQFTPICK